MKKRPAQLIKTKGLNFTWTADWTQMPWAQCLYHKQLSNLVRSMGNIPEPKLTPFQQGIYQPIEEALKRGQPFVAHFPIRHQEGKSWLAAFMAFKFSQMIPTMPIIVVVSSHQEVDMIWGLLRSFGELKGMMVDVIEWRHCLIERAQMGHYRSLWIIDLKVEQISVELEDLTPMSRL
jgi:hypothetical protein